MENFGFYLVMTNPKVGYVECAKAAVKAGVKILQLRMKHCPRAEIVATAKEVRAVTAGTDTVFIVNDDPSIAAEGGRTACTWGRTTCPSRRCARSIRR